MYSLCNLKQRHFSNFVLSIRGRPAHNLTDCVPVCQTPKPSHQRASQLKMDLCQKEFLLLVQLIAGTFLRVTVPEGYNKYIGS